MDFFSLFVRCFAGFIRGSPLEVLPEVSQLARILDCFDVPIGTPTKCHFLALMADGRRTVKKDLLSYVFTKIIILTLAILNIPAPLFYGYGNYFLLLRPCFDLAFPLRIHCASTVHPLFVSRATSVLHPRLNTRQSFIQPRQRVRLWYPVYSFGHKKTALSGRHFLFLSCFPRLRIMALSLVHLIIFPLPAGIRPADPTNNPVFLA